MSDNYDVAIDDALRGIHGDVLANACGYSSNVALRGQMRTTPLGILLCQLARIARGEETLSIKCVSRSVRALLAVVFWSEHVDSQRVEAFYSKDPLGRMLMRAKWRCVTAHDLLTIEAAAGSLGVDWATIGQWMLADTIEFVRDEATGRSFVLRVDVDRLRAKPATFEHLTRLDVKGRICAFDWISDTGGQEIDAGQHQVDSDYQM